MKAPMRTPTLALGRGVARVPVGRCGQRRLCQPWCGPRTSAAAPATSSRGRTTCASRGTTRMARTVMRCITWVSPSCVCGRVRSTHSRVVACVSRHHRHPAAVRYEEKPGNHLQELCDEEEHDLFRESDAVRRPVQGVHGPNHRIAVNSNNFNILNTHVSRTLQAERERCLHIFGCEPFSTAALLCTPQSSKPRVELCLGRAVTHGTQTARRSLGI